MRSIIRKVFLTALLIYMTGLLFAQTVNKVTFAAKGKQVILETKGASMDIEGYDGDNLVIESYKQADKLASGDIAKGMTLISDIKAENSNINPTVIKDDVTILSILIPEGGYKYLKIKVPNKTYLKVKFFDLSPNSKISLKNLSGELEIGGTASIIEINNISGPLTLSGGGDKDGEGASERITLTHLLFNQSAANDVTKPLLNIISRYANVDISLPEDLKATIQVDVPSGGELFSDLNLIPPKPVTREYVPPLKNKFIGELNGGGRTITINAGYGNVFIRKQQ